MHLGAEGRGIPKVPTLINYDPLDKSTFTWGASIGWMDQSESVVGVKLLLDPSQQMPHYLKVTNAKRDIKKLPKPPVHIACDYIGAMYKHALSEITKTVPADFLAMCQKQFVMSGNMMPKDHLCPRFILTLHNSPCGLV